MSHRFDQLGNLRRIGALLLAATAALGCNRFTASRVEPPPPGAAAGPRQVVALGQLEPAGGVISISSIPGEQLLSLAPGVVEGATVAAGDELARMASYTVRQVQLDAAGVKLRLARQQRDQQRATAQLQVEQAQAALAQAEARLQETLSQEQQLQSLGEAAAIARDDLEQLERLRQSDPELVTDQQLRRRRNASERAAKEHESAVAVYPHALAAAEKSVEAARASVRLAESNLRMAEEVDQTLAVEMEQAAAQAALEQSVLRAPLVEGGSAQFTVLRVLMQPGELVAQTPVLELGDLSRMVCVAEVYEADVKEIHVGQEAAIRSPAFAGKYAERPGQSPGAIKGRVIRVGGVVSSPGLTNRNPLAPSDRSIVEVVVAIDPTDREATAEAARRIGLQVTVEFAERSEAAAQQPGA
ncbi:MAG: hypothetical protein DCC67_01815 [Planctomycetota bacterium]|nr:MAG: hypothetical protein DCC67_01815 [Planctomycetota bacterium]